MIIIPFALLLAGAIVFATVSLLKAWIMVPSAHYGVVYRLRKRTGRILDEGNNWIVPYVDTVRAVSTELRKKNASGEFTAADDTSLTVSGSLQYRADRTINEPNPDPNIKRNRYVAVSEEVLETGITDAIKRVLGALGGTHTGDEFRSMRDAINRLLNCYLRLRADMLPHMNHDKGDPEKCGVADCKYDEKEIPVVQRLDFYNSHWKMIKHMLDHEKQNSDPTAKSEIELRYGIDVEVFELAQVDFTAEIKKAREAQKEAEKRALIGVQKRRLIGQARRLGANFPQASNYADTILVPEIARNKRVISVEGDAGVLGALAANFGQKGGNT